MGVVYAARDERLERPVALKMISSRSYDETARRRFWREARTAASVNHPNVCQIYEIGEDQGHLFIAMELLDGESLHKRLQHGPLEVAAGDRDRPRHARGARRLCTREGSSIATSNPRTCSSHRTASSCSISAWRGPRPSARARHSDRVDRKRDGDRHAALYGARADRRRPGRGCAQQSVRRRHYPLRDALWTPRLCRTERRRNPARHGVRAAAGAHRTAGGGRGESRDPKSAGQDDQRIGPRLPIRWPASCARFGWTAPPHTSAVAQALTRLVVLPFRDAARRCRDQLSRLQPPGCDCDFALRARIADRALECRRRALRRRGARTSRRSPPRPDVDRVVMGTLLRAGNQLRVHGAAGRNAGRDDDGVAHDRVSAARSLPPSGRSRPPHRRRAGLAAGRRANAVAGSAAGCARIRVIPAGQRARAHL